MYLDHLPFTRRDDDDDNDHDYHDQDQDLQSIYIIHNHRSFVLPTLKKI